jgi:hypothetical protein
MSMNDAVRKTRFKYKNIVNQISDWRDAYVMEYNSYPTVITMDSFTALELKQFINVRNAIFAPSPGEKDHFMGMLIEVSDAR